MIEYKKIKSIVEEKQTKDISKETMKSTLLLAIASATKPILRKTLGMLTGLDLMEEEALYNYYSANITLTNDDIIDYTALIIMEQPEEALKQIFDNTNQ